MAITEIGVHIKSLFTIEKDQNGHKVVIELHALSNRGDLLPWEPNVPPTLGVGSMQLYHADLCIYWGISS